MHIIKYNCSRRRACTAQWTDVTPIHSSETLLAKYSAQLFDGGKTKKKVISLRGSKLLEAEITKGQISPNMRSLNRPSTGDPAPSSGRLYKTRQ